MVDTADNRQSLDAINNSTVMTLNYQQVNIFTSNDFVCTV